jgi:hypothetical protein
VSEYVVLCLLLPGVVVTWLVTGFRALHVRRWKSLKCEELPRHHDFMVP